MIYDYFWVTGAHEAVLDYSDLFRKLYKRSVFREGIGHPIGPSALPN